jgi:hypothetical protein
LKINKIYTDYYNEEFIHRIAQQEQIPIFNDNLLYSDSKYQYIMNHLELPIKGLFYVGYDNPAEDDFNIQLMRSFEDIRIIKHNIFRGTKIKASGGIHTKKDMNTYIRLGCDRIGASKLP